MFYLTTHSTQLLYQCQTRWWENIAGSTEQPEDGYTTGLLRTIIRKKLNVLFNHTLNTLFTVIWRWGYGINNPLYSERKPTATIKPAVKPSIKLVNKCTTDLNWITFSTRCNICVPCWFYLKERWPEKSTNLCILGSRRWWEWFRQAAMWHRRQQLLHRHHVYIVNLQL